MRLTSVQVGAASQIEAGSRSWQTGIVKRAVAHAQLSVDGVVGDRVVNTEHHGGVDQAVYAYSVEDYAYFESKLGRTLAPGTFGENLTTDGLPGEIRIGDRFTIGADALIEVTASRIPCGTFAAIMERQGWVEEFRAARRPGFYARVLAPGSVRPGDEITLLEAPPANISLVESFDLYYDRQAGRERLEAALASPVAMRARADYQRRLERLGT